MDEIIHLGDYWNETAMRKGRQDVIRINSQVGSIFERAYRYLKAAAQIYEDSAVLYASAADEAKINLIAGELTREVFEGIPTADKVGRERRLFASAITPDGLKNYLDDLIVSENIYMLEGPQGQGTAKVLERIRAEAVERGFDLEAYYCAFNPDKLEHLIIPGLDTAFTTVNKYHTTDACACKIVDFGGLLDENAIAAVQEELDFNRLEFDMLLDKAIGTIKKAKALHDEMETYYIPHMDFRAVQICWESTMSRILEYAGEN